MTNARPMTDAFRDAFRRHPAGVAIIAADAPDGPVALTVSSLISVCAAPPVVAFSLSASSRASAAIVKAGTIVIHLLRYADQDLARLCATSGADRFGPGIDWERLPTGEPRYRSVTTWFRARLLGTTPVDGATLVTATLLEGEAAAEEDGGLDALVYLDRRWHRLG